MKTDGPFGALAFVCAGAVFVFAFGVGEAVGFTLGLIICEDLTTRLSVLDEPKD